MHEKIGRFYFWIFLGGILSKGKRLTAKKWLPFRMLQAVFALHWEYLNIIWAGNIFKFSFGNIDSEIG